MAASCENLVVFRLIACDLDGTLLSKAPPIPERNVSALRRAAELGIELVLVSARAPRGMRAIVEELGIEGPAICMNGALVYDFSSESVLRYLPIEIGILRNIVGTLRRHLPGTVFHWELPSSFGREEAYEALSPLKTFDKVALRTVGDPLEVAEAVGKLVARHPDHDSASLANALSDLLTPDLVLTISGPTFIEISAAGATKAAALEWWCTERGISAEEVIAFGDMLNDIPMLTWAGRSVAMANAHPDVKVIADEITGSNVDAGVAQTLEPILDGLTLS